MIFNVDMLIDICMNYWLNQDYYVPILEIDTAHLNTVKRKLSITRSADLKMMTTEPYATPQILGKYPYFSPGTVSF